MPNNQNQAATRAVENVRQYIDLAGELPGTVFRGHWERYFFFPSDRMFELSFAEFIRALKRAEGAETICMANLDAVSDFNADDSALYFFEDDVDEGAFGSVLVEKREGVEWLYGMDRYACSSDLGNWCIYCEKANDIAVLALGDVDDVKFRPALDLIEAAGIKELTNGTSAIFPFDQLTSHWRDQLIFTYG